jgi:hypothetical protein
MGDLKALLRLLMHGNQSSQILDTLLYDEGVYIGHRANVPERDKLVLSGELRVNEASWSPQ